MLKGYVISLKVRLDVLLTEQGHFLSREKAKAAIMAGLVYIDGCRFDKPGMPVDADSAVEIRKALCPYVGRGGLKLEKALKTFKPKLKNKVAIDIGASTGGFTDCMLKHGISKVYAIDVGYGQLDYTLRNDDRVIVMERTNIRHVDADKFPEPSDFISIDVSFISLKLVFPIAAKLLKKDGELICLIKPQFEAGRKQVGKNGVVREAHIHKEVITNVTGYAAECDLFPKALTWSPITGPKGNIEFLLMLTKQKRREPAPLQIDNIIAEAHKELRND